MKKMIHEVVEQSGNNYQLWAELSECARPEGYKTLKFYSMYTGAKDPEVPWNKGQFFLPPESLKNLKELLEGVE
ncbi:hypothetical protein UFOVP112_417 [uncultured Caudovirales phage]|uniref:Uncharacterized protein n=1 Tax=uncultured Caudovirales phage TaxID=2100421 RepID=A0A6J5LC92_9CAUD|nr:hypothetical protein UFOVP112_417 [uncultured Caudovirales phage]